MLNINTSYILAKVNINSGGLCDKLKQNKYLSI